jgi:glycosyltransferase involved in cell wall biosynthesis
LYQQQLPQLPILAAPLGCLNFPVQDAEKRRIKRKVVYIGHLHSYKGSDFIFEIAKAFQSKNINLTCYGGHEPQIKNLRSKAHQLGLDDVLKFETFVSPANLHHILDHQVSIGLVPLQDTFYSRYLTCPVKALDFLSHGLPIIASELPSLREVLREAGVYCFSSDAVQFAQAIEALLDSNTIYQAASQKSYQRNTKLQWPLRAKKILQLVAQ